MKTSVNQHEQNARIFGIPIQGWSLEELLRWSFNEEVRAPKWIVTANPEILLRAHHEPAYAQVLRQADNICVDGFGLWLMLRLKGIHSVRVTGVELGEGLMKRAATQGLKVGFVGGDPGIAERVANMWQEKYPSLQVAAERGGRINSDGTGDAAEEEAVHRLVLEAPDILLVAFGGGTKQEAWIARRIQDIPSLKVVVGVGGAFDFWSGRLSRAPRWLRAIGLEWLWRLAQEPRRFGRIVRATIIFPCTVMWNSICQK